MSLIRRGLAKGFLRTYSCRQLDTGSVEEDVVVIAVVLRVVLRFQSSVRGRKSYGLR